MVGRRMSDQEKVALQVLGVISSGCKVVAAADTMQQEPGRFESAYRNKINDDAVDVDDDDGEDYDEQRKRSISGDGSFISALSSTDSLLSSYMDNSSEQSSEEGNTTDGGATTDDGYSGGSGGSSDSGSSSSGRVGDGHGDHDHDGDGDGDGDGKRRHDMVDMDTQHFAGPDV